MRRSAVLEPHDKAEEEKMKFDKDGFGPLSQTKVDFLRHVGIQSVDEFMKTQTAGISDSYNEWREDNGLPPLKEMSSANNTLNKWKSDVRKHYIQFIGTNDEASQESKVSPAPEIELLPESTEEHAGSQDKSMKRLRSSAETQESQGKSAKRSRSSAETQESQDKSMKRSRSSAETQESQESLDKSFKMSRSSAETQENQDRSVKKSRGSAETQESQDKSVKKSRGSTETQENSDDSVVEHARPLKKSRPQLEINASYSESTQGDDEGPGDNSKANDRVRSKRTRLVRDRQTPTSSVEKSVDNVKSTTYGTRPRRSNQYREGSLKETDDDTNDNDSNDADFKDADFEKEDSSLPKPAKKRRGRPPNIERKIFLPDEAIDFLKKLGITTARGFLTSNTGRLASAYSEFRVETNQKPLKGCGAASKVSSWKRVVKDAARAEGITDDNDSNDADFKDADFEKEDSSLPKPAKKRRGRPPNIERKIFHKLPYEAIVFLKKLGITTARGFLTSNTGRLASAYSEFRVETNQKPLKGCGAASKVSMWKRVVKDAARAEGVTDLVRIYTIRGRRPASFGLIGALGLEKQTAKAAAKLLLFFRSKNYPGPNNGEN